MNKRQLVQKWEAAEGKMSIKDVKDPYVKENLAQLLENQEQKDWNGEDMFTEASQGSVNTTQMGADGQIYTQYPGSQSYAQNSDAWKFRPVALALVRRTFPDLFANKCVGVQALSTPVGLAYALRVIYKDTAQEAAWQQVDWYAGFTGNQVGTSGAFAGAYLNTSAATGIYDTSGAGAVTSAAEGWTLPNACDLAESATAGCGSWPQLELRIDQTAIEARTRKLAASFSLEAAQDIRAMHGVDVEREMVNVLQYEVTAELDRELLYRMKLAATSTANGGEAVAAIDVQPSTSGYGRWSGESYMAIIAAILEQANKIAITTRRGAGNFVVVSPSIATALQGAGHQFVQYKADVNPTTVLSQIGKLNGTIDVYRDSYARTSYALVGYKGPGISDTGLIFSPYIMGLSNRAIHPDDFTPRIGVMSRYAITDTLLGAGRYYRLIPFYNLNTIIPGASVGQAI